MARLIDALLTSEPIAREAAAARLAILGARGLERLSATLQGLQTPEHTVAILDVLERIGDVRSAASVCPLLTNPDPTIAAAAVAVVRRALQSDNAEAAARATDDLLGLALNPATLEPVKRAALDALADLPEDIVAALRGRLGQVPAASTGAPAAAPSPPFDVERWLEGQGEGGLDHLPEALNRIGGSAPLPLLRRLVERLREAERTAAAGVQADWRRLRGLAHQRLAERGSRVALYDLRETIEDGAELPVSMLAALQLIGDASCVEAVADAWERTSDAWLKDQLRDALQTIITREGLTRRHAAYKRMTTRHPELIGGLSTPSQTRP